jgi:hypothetical protein
MSLLYRIVYAAHANGTHHKLALDALARVQSANSERWQNLFLKYAKRYLEGSKAPDNTFKDFKNHVLHVRDDYWGGAPEKAQEWYGELLKALRGQAWSDAAYAAGVLSHYYIDPIQPFHTGQTEAENAIHRACEWSINRSYDDLAKLGRERFAQIEVAVPDGEHWLKDMVCQGAEASNRYYEKLIAHYDIHRGAVDPPAGLDRACVRRERRDAAGGAAHGRCLPGDAADAGEVDREEAHERRGPRARAQHVPRAAGDGARRGYPARGRPHCPQPLRDGGRRSARREASRRTRRAPGEVGLRKDRRCGPRICRDTEGSASANRT